MRDDLNDLKKELGLARSTALTSREVIVTASAVLGAGAFAATHPGLAGIAGAGALIAAIGSPLTLATRGDEAQSRCRPAQSPSKSR